MKLAISNIAWNEADENEVLDVLKQLKVSGIEFAPTRYWKDPLQVGSQQIEEKKEELTGKGLRIIAAQALLYGHPELTIFDAHEIRERTLSYLKGIIKLCAHMGAEALVFGSPANRKRGHLSDVEALDIAIDFFREASITALEHGTCLCIEPNPIEYGCDFVRNTSEAVDLVRRVGHPAFKLNVDGSAITLNHEDPRWVLDLAFEWMGHFHISEPHLVMIGRGGTDHASLAKILKEFNYQGWVSIEMRSGQLSPNAEAVKSAIQHCSLIYLAEN